jgi:membrane-associated phospholipid phosphatase
VAMAPRTCPPSSGFWRINHDTHRAANPAHGRTGWCARQISCPWGGHYSRMSRTPETTTAVPQGPDARFGARAVLAAIALTLIAVPFGLLLFLVQDKWRPLLRVDDGARDDLYTYALDHSWFVAAMKILTTSGSTLVYLVVFAAVVGWLARHRRARLAVFVVVTMVGNSLLNTVVKLSVDRARPVLPNPVAHANGLSFPSGHAQAAVVAYSVLLLVFLPALRGPWRRLAILFAVLMVVGIGFSRVALGVHYARPTCSPGMSLAQRGSRR